MDKLFLYFFESYPSNIPYCRISNEILKNSNGFGYQSYLVTFAKKNKVDKFNAQSHTLENNYKIKFLFNLFKNKSFNYLWFSLLTFFHILFVARGTIIVPSTPPVFMGFFSALAKKILKNRIKLVYHVQDIHPEALKISNPLISKLAYKFLLLLDNFTLKHADIVLTLSQDMKNTLLSRKVISNIFVCNNFILTNKKSSGKDFSFYDDKENSTKFIFSGNIGSFQNLLPIVKAFCDERNENSKFYILGDGNTKKSLSDYVNKISSNKVVFLDKVSSDIADNIVSCADVGIVSLIPGMLSVAFPSKVISYLNVGLPILSITDYESQLTGFLKDNQLGWSTPNSSHESLVNMINEISLSINNEEINSKMIIKTCENIFNTQRVTRNMFEIIKGRTHD